jgi:hypothetical protein
MSEVCTWRRDPAIGRWFLPGCLGGAVYGERGCTCDRRKNTAAERITQLEQQVEELKATVARLEATR